MGNKCSFRVIVVVQFCAQRLKLRQDVIMGSSNLSKEWKLIHFLMNIGVAFWMVRSHLYHFVVEGGKTKTVFEPAFECL